MKIAFQMDYLKDLNFASDSSYMLIQEAYKEHFEVYFYSPKSMSWVDGKLLARVSKVSGFIEAEIPIIYEELGLLDLSTMDYIFLRQDPPFDMAYITSTFLLEKVMDKVIVLNNPVSVRNSPEKLMVTDFYHLMPKTLITSDFDVIWKFLEDNKKAVIKPLYGNAGSDVFFLDINDFNAKSIVNYFLNNFKEQIMVQEFLPNVKNGDKRIILIDGEPVAFINRVPANNEIRSNLAAGGTAHKTELSKQELDICKEIAPTLKKLGLFFTGIDVIDGKLTEINVTSPTGLKAYQKLSGENIAEFMIQKLLNNKKS